MNDFFDNVHIDEKVVQEQEVSDNWDFSFLITPQLYEYYNPFGSEILDKLVKRNIDALIFKNSEIMKYKTECIDYQQPNSSVMISTYQRSNSSVMISINGEFHSTIDCLEFLWSIISIFFRYENGNNGYVKFQMCSESPLILYTTFGQYSINISFVWNIIKIFRSYIKNMVYDKSEFNQEEISNFIYSRLPSFNIQETMQWHINMSNSVKKEEFKENVRLAISPQKEIEHFNMGIKNLIANRKILFRGLPDLISNQTEKKVKLAVSVAASIDNLGHTPEHMLFNPCSSGELLAVHINSENEFVEMTDAFYNNYKKLLNVKNSTLLKSLDRFNKEFFVFNNYFNESSDECPVFSAVFYLGLVLDEKTNKNYGISVSLTGTPRNLLNALCDLHS